MSEFDTNKVSAAPEKPSRALLIWGLFRIPALLVLLFLFREPISALPVFDGVGIIVRVIDLISLTASRTLLFLILAVVLGLLVLVSLRLRPVSGYVLLLGATVAITVILFSLTGTPLRHALIPILIAATNFLPEAFLRRRTNNLGMAIAVGASEGLIVRRHVSWLGELAGLKSSAQQTITWIGWALAIVLLSASIVVLVKGGRLIPIEQALRSPAGVSILMHEDINGLALDTESRRLYATGHGLERIVEFDLDNLDAAPRVSDVVSGGAQGIFYDNANKEFSVYQQHTKQVLYIDAETLTLNRAVDVPTLAPGDPWIAFDPISDTVALVSEADIQEGSAFLLLDHASGEILDERDLDAGNLSKHPTKPWLYLSFFRRSPEVLIYDMAAREIIGRTAAPARVDRLILVESMNEILVTSPVGSEILRLDADTLESKGVLKAPFGVRTLAYDPEREILLAGSFVTGQITTIDLRTSRPTGTIYLGPWLRSIEIDGASGIAYVSSNGALYRWKYD